MNGLAEQVATIDGLLVVATPVRWPWPG